MLSKARTIDAAAGKWPGILVALGVDDRFLGKKHGACPFCGGGSDRYRFDDKNGSGSFICSQCGAGNGMEFVVRFLGVPFREAAAAVDRVVGNVEVSRRTEERTEAQKVQAIKRVLRECRTVVHGDPVWKYLNGRTGIELIPSDIKFHPALFHKDGGQHPAMIAVMRGPDGTGVTLHRTYLTEQGEKASVDPVKMLMPGKALRGACVRLSRVDEHIGIGEGIETSLAAAIRFGIPTWAATNATLLEQWMPPEGVKRVRICGDNDASYVGQAAAYNLAKRLVRDGFAVEISIPDGVDTDFCDAC